MDNISKYALNVLIGSTFILSSILKLISIDTFELFIYEHFEFSFVVASILSRFFILIEFTIGMLYLFNFFNKFRFFASSFLLIGFSYFLYQFFYLENCFCFGESLPFTAKQGIIKNIILFILCCLSYFLAKESNPKRLFLKRIILSISLLVGFVTTFIITPPDFIIKTIYSNGQSHLDDFEITNKLKIEIMDSAFNFYQFEKEENVFYPFFSATCPYCKNALMKIEIINDKYNIKDKTKILIVGDSLKIDTFLQNTSVSFKHEKMYVDHFMSMTEGKIPSYFFRKNNKYYRLKVHELDDNIIKEFLY